MKTRSAFISTISTLLSLIAVLALTFGRTGVKRTFRSYPIDWTVSILSMDAEFEVTPLFDDQTFTGLWEGLYDVRGRVGDFSTERASLCGTEWLLMNPFNPE